MGIIDELLHLVDDLPVEDQLRTIHEMIQAGIAAGIIVAIQGAVDVRYLHRQYVSQEALLDAISLEQVKKIHAEVEREYLAGLN